MKNRVRRKAERGFLSPALAGSVPGAVQMVVLLQVELIHFLAAIRRSYLA